METIKKKDFVEIEFVGKANSEIFDTNIKGKMKELNPNLKEEELDVKPLIVCVGREMLVKGFDEALEGKEIGREYSIKLAPEKAFGRREPKLVKTIPIKLFIEKNIMPRVGMMLYLDDFLVKIISVSSGRVITDFNNPLAGKVIEYEFKIKRKITDTKEKINALMEFFFKKRFDFSLEDKKLIIRAEKDLKEMLDSFGEKIKEILGDEIKEAEVKEAEIKEAGGKEATKEESKTK